MQMVWRGAVEVHLDFSSGVHLVGLLLAKAIVAVQSQSKRERICHLKKFT